MADYYAGSIDILKRDIERCPELKKAIAAYFYEDTDIEMYDENGELNEPQNEYGDNWDYMSNDVASYYDPEARYGQFEDIEEVCKKHKIPYDAWSGSYCEYDAHTDYYRPEMPKIIEANGDGDRIVWEPELKKLLEGVKDFNSLDEQALIGRRLIDFIDKNLPEYKDLEDYLKNE